MGNVIDIGCITRLEVDPEKVMRAALEEKQLQSVVLIGFDQAGEFYFASSVADGGTVLWLMEKCKQALMDYTP